MHVPLSVCLLAASVSSIIASPARASTTKKITTTTKKATSTTAVATTTSAVAVPTATYMHDCSVFIERWTYYPPNPNFPPYDNSYVFDISYYAFHLTDYSQGPQIVIQETPPLKEGVGFDRDMGSHALRVVNTANPVTPYVFSLADPGKVTVSWGSWVGKSWDPATNCTENIFTRGQVRATYLCYFQCDVPFPT